MTYSRLRAGAENRDPAPAAGRLIKAGKLTLAALLGTGAIVLPGRRVGQGAVVAAGAVVIDDVEPGSTVIGVPAR